LILAARVSGRVGQVGCRENEQNECTTTIPIDFYATKLSRNAESP